MAYAGRDAEVFHIQIADDGAGFDVESRAHQPGEGFGLVGMRERARLLGGQMELHSVPGTGTRIDIVIPNKHVSHIA